MSLQNVVAPIDVYLDARGRPLNDGAVYIGAPGMDPETDPVPVFWDADGTIPATQPLQTIGGYIVNNGSPAVAYVDDQYSIRVRDRFGAQVYYVAVVDTASSQIQTLIDGLASDDGATMIGHNYNQVGSTRRTLAKVIFDRGVDVTGFGVVADGSTNDYPNWKRAFDYAVSVGAPLWNPPSTQPMLWDLQGGSAVLDPTRLVRGARGAIKIHGAGARNTAVNIVNATNVGVQWASSTDWFDFWLEGMTFYGAFNFPLMVIGKNDFSDPSNIIFLQNVSIENGFNGANNEALRINDVAGGSCINLRAVAYADGLGNNNGVGLRIRQVRFTNFSGGAFGNGMRGVDFTDGSSIGLTFASNTFENCNIPFSHRTATSGGHVFTGSQLTEVVDWAIESTGMLNDRTVVFDGFTFESSPGAGAVLLNPTPGNTVGVILRDRAGVVTPSVPLSTVPVTNDTGRRLSVRIWGGNVSVVAINGFGTAVANPTSVSWELQPNDTIAITYTGVPQWNWQNVSA